MRRAVGWFIGFSLAFLAAALYRADYLRVPEIRSARDLAAAMVLVALGFLAGAGLWHATARRAGHDIPWRVAIAGEGLAIFGKYIPGKIWMVVGRAGYAAVRTGRPIGSLSAISLNAQFITLWTGLLLGGVGLTVVGGFEVWGGAALLLWLGLSVAVFSRIVHVFVERVFAKAFRRTITLPVLMPRSVIAVLPWFAANWLLWVVGFHFLAVALLGRELPWATGLGFPLAATLGIMAIIVPGGLGVREGILVGYLSLAGLSLPEATTVAVTARLWFLVGEAFIFCCGLVMHWKSGDRSPGSVDSSATKPSSSTDES